MSYLSDLQSQKSDKEKQLKSYKKRLTQVDTIYSNVINEFSDDISKVNTQCDTTMTNCSTGIKQCTNISIQNNSLRGLKEKTVYSDGNMSEVKDQLYDEQKRIKRIIAELEREINSVANKIAAEKEAQKSKN